MFYSLWDSEQQLSAEMFLPNYVALHNNFKHKIIYSVATKNSLAFIDDKTLHHQVSFTIDVLFNLKKIMFAILSLNFG